MGKEKKRRAVATKNSLPDCLKENMPFPMMDKA